MLACMYAVTTEEKWTYNLEKLKYNSRIIGDEQPNIWLDMVDGS